MSTTKLEQHDISQHALLSIEKVIEHHQHTVHTDVEHDRICFNQCHVDTLNLKIDLFYKQIQLVIRSILPDLKSLKSWQIIALIFYAIFNVIFSILVEYC
jgi:hypothetical protein